MRSIPQLPGQPLRWGGVLLLLAGLWIAASLFPTRPDDSWSTVHGFELDGAECQAMRQERQTSPLTMPPDAEAPVSVAEAAEKFKLERRLVCRANGLPDSCGGETVAAGDDPLQLPLYRQLDAGPPDTADSAEPAPTGEAGGDDG